MSEEIVRSPYTEQLEKFDQTELRDIAHVKRFLECFGGDQEFRESVQSGERDLKDLAAERGCLLDDLDSLRPVFDEDFTQFRQDATDETWRLTALWDRHYLSLLGSLQFYRWVGDSGGLFPEFDEWRQKQIARTLLDLGPMGNSIIHPSASFELSDGCSVGCWFCGISADKFGGHFSLEGDGRAFWRETIKSVSSVLGRGMTTGFLYWATDPLDHPDYPEFLDIFHEEIGVLPQTTTAIPMRDVALTRSVLERWETSRVFPNRFSVLTTQILKRIHKEFSAEELLGVELVMQNAESLQPKQIAGKAISSNPQSERRKKEKMQSGTIACVTGFLINMPKRTVRLVSPTLATPELPDGFYVYDEATWASPDDLAGIMRKMVLNEAKRTIDPNAPLKINSNFWFESDGGAYRLRQENMGFGMELFSSIGPLMESGESSPKQLIKKAIQDGHDPIVTIKVMSELAKAGVVGDILRPQKSANGETVPAE